MLCQSCRRLNPGDAKYCWFDGASLDPRTKLEGPIDTSRLAFLTPFLFPSGRMCRNFEELALACQEEWPAATDMLRRGFLEQFLGQIGRADLAQSARNALRLPDIQQGLNYFLTKVPNRVLPEPKLRVEPANVHLGVVPHGQDRTFQLRLRNDGKRLIHGSVATMRGWLAVGDGAGAQAKLFQFRDELVISIRVRGALLRARAQPLEGEVVVETNGGTATVPVTLSVPVKPFAEGVLAGAATPRELAHKATANPPAAASLFENGAVPRWYETNGWTYPVKTPTAAGVGAIQQFFEAQGLVRPPKVEPAETAVSLTAPPGGKAQHMFKLHTHDNHVVWAVAAPSQPWLEVGPVLSSNRMALLPLLVRAAPHHPGDVLTANLTVTTNGNRQFHIPVRLAVAATPARKPAAVPVGVPTAAPVAIPVGAAASAQPAPQAKWVPPAHHMPVPPAHHAPVATAHVPAAPTAPIRAIPVPQPQSVPQAHQPTPRSQSPRWPYLFGLGFLLLGFLGAVIHDLLLKPEQASSSVLAPLVDSNPRIAVQFHDQNVDVKLGPTGLKPADGQEDANHTPAIWEPSMRFGVTMIGQADPNHPGSMKRLTYSNRGLTNNTCVRVDGQEWLFGERPFRLQDGKTAGNWPGRWLQQKTELGTDPVTGLKIDGCKSSWIYDDPKIVVTQTVAIVPGDQSRLLDTVRVSYRIDNQDRVMHRVGLRCLLDTFIGANDGVPFTIPGASQLCDTTMQFNQPQEVPDFLEALERSDLRDPGTIAHLGFIRGPHLDPPDRVTLGAWPNFRLHVQDQRCLQEKTLWEVPVLPIKQLTPPDSAVTMYWNDRDLSPGTSRELAWTYGLGNVASNQSQGRLGITVGGSFVAEGEFTVTAYVSNPAANETISLDLPAGFTLLAGVAAEQTVPPLPPGAVSPNSPVSWKVRGPSAPGQYVLKVRASSGVAENQPLTIRPKHGILD